MKLNTNYWDEVAKKGHYLESITGEYKGEDLKRILDEWNINLNGRILKTDCFEEAHGSDQLLFRIAKENPQVYGIDISKETIKKAKNRQQEYKCKKRHFSVTNVKDLPFKDEFFDVIISHSTLDHFPKDELPKAIKELKRVLKKDGVLILTLHNKHNPIFYWSCMFGKVTGLLPYYTTFFSFKEAEMIGVQNGMKILKKGTTFHLINQSHKIIKFLRENKLITKKLVKKYVQFSKWIGKTRMNKYTGWFIALKCVKK